MVDRSRYDVAIVGGGIVGLATAFRLLGIRPGLRLVVLEKEPALAAHQSGHNSGVVHAGLYYPPGSLKARLCREGKTELETFCSERAIPLEPVGKLVVALREAELPGLTALVERARANAVPEIEVVGPERLREIEPHAAGVRALWSPTTSIVDFRRVALAFGDAVVAHGGEIRLSSPVTAIRRSGTDLILSVAGGEAVSVGAVVACAGLWSDRVAAMTEEPPVSSGTAQRAVPDRSPRIVPFRGDYHTLTADSRHLVRGLIYPVPDPRFPFLGIHLTRRIDGEVWAGPNAVLAFAREGYRRRDVSVRDLAGILADPGFLRLARRFWRTGMAEMWRDWSTGAFHAGLVRYLPELRRDQLTFGPSGVRAQALTRDGSLIDDFDLGGRDRVLHVRNAPSPAATSSLAIGRVLAVTALERFDL